MKRSIGAILAVAMITVACGSGRSTQFATGSAALVPTSSISSPTPEPILGTWRMEYTCEKFLRAFTRAGLGQLAPQAIASFHLQKGPVEPGIGSAGLCEGTDEFQRTHVFRPNGYLTNYQGDRLVDDCRCYMLVDDHTFVVLGDPGGADIPLRYRIDADAGTLTFEAAPPDPCSARCQSGYAFAIGQFAVGVWHRVN
ncbi:MAG: hypothetical protein ABI869_06300 [Actinomycetota bacterium]